VLVNIVISAVVLLAVNLLERNEGKHPAAHAQKHADGNARKRPPRKGGEKRPAANTRNKKEGKKK